MCERSAVRNHRATPEYTVTDVCTFSQRVTIIINRDSYSLTIYQGLLCARSCTLDMGRNAAILGIKIAPTLKGVYTCWQREVRSPENWARGGCCSWVPCNPSSPSQGSNLEPRGWWMLPGSPAKTCLLLPTLYSSLILACCTETQPCDQIRSDQITGMGHVMASGKGGKGRGRVWGINPNSATWWLRWQEISSALVRIVCQGWVLLNN